MSRAGAEDADHDAKMTSDEADECHTRTGLSVEPSFELSGADLATCDDTLEVSGEREGGAGDDTLEVNGAD